ncbi:hypothetical protein, partial [Treponema putidum]
GCEAARLRGCEAARLRGCEAANFTRYAVLCQELCKNFLRFFIKKHTVFLDALLYHRYRV